MTEDRKVVRAGRKQTPARVAVEDANEYQRQQKRSGAYWCYQWYRRERFALCQVAQRKFIRRNPNLPVPCVRKSEETKEFKKCP